MGLGGQKNTVYSQCMLDVTRLRVLVAVARYGSVTAAARALNYAQPSVRHHLARLEAGTGTAAAAMLRDQQPSADLRLTEAEPPEALRMLRAGYVDVALVFRYSAPSPSPASPGRGGGGAVGGGAVGGG